MNINHIIKNYTVQKFAVLQLPQIYVCIDNKLQDQLAKCLSSNLAICPRNAYFLFDHLQRHNPIKFW